ncbi:DNA repair protein RecN [Xylella fastidiosa]|uniref:DNA repair protein RecN n=1 Tax=Xylella fastidiosa (strain 9a5c) TaxID=160492 RepID=RECN_XYLFA|nr:DNA repair protein RecN [Xylella fastidiosa]Q9PB02.1 RecName: Full=DNA repair protein RecN; AltName: Full=Recombination protein N [Xylella fastidiosa 9a5c]AAF85142.1 recombination protein N [Xylella fastidiosa 9a5c]ALQ95439.1 DNA recombination protein RecN [Xylella fastidiosa]ALQ96552.1 DNA repair protein RecN [Xylella fastidiosa]ALR01436.1 DNA recombination protein RecN [Xylella fastidiosa]ALR08439.2 DNA repair protein RecN [Xylella fastidiosa]
MLRHLTIKDFAVVRNIELEFGPGMTVVSGETGAGKSLIIDALGFLSGLRADSSVVRHGAERAELSAEFNITIHHPARVWLRNVELDDADQCQLRRIIRADGGSRAWINARPVTLSQLSDLATHLVEIHGQHEHQTLLSRQSQLVLLDAYAQNETERDAVQQAAAHWQALLDERDALQAQGDMSERINFIEHQLTELQRENLDPATITALDASHRRQAHTAALIEACKNTTQTLNGDDTTSALHLLHAARHTLSRVTEHDARLGEVETLLDNAMIQVDEALTLLDRIHNDLNIDPEQLEAIELRIGRLHSLARKYRCTPLDLAAQRDRMAAEVESMRNMDIHLQQLDHRISNAMTKWRQAAEKLSISRTRAAAALSTTTTNLINELGMGGGQLLIQLQPHENNRPHPNGAERTEFLIATNPGQPPRPLRKIASGGELSRVSLAIMVAALGLDTVPTMVFDEVDTGIGGAIADIVGQKLRALGEQHQVLCVTHLPQVAAKGHTHYRVSKIPIDGITQSAICLLDSQERQEEIARMLGGVHISKEAHAAAGKLLQELQEM